MSSPTLYGVIHLPPLSASPNFGKSLQAVLDHAIFDAKQYLEGGFNGLIIENFGDAPFHKEVDHSTVADMTWVATHIHQLVNSKMEIGINVLRNDAKAALSIANATGADFIRVNVHCASMYTDQGFIEGKAAETLRLRKHLSSNCRILADVGVKHASPPPGFDLSDAAKETAYRGCADGLIVSGSATGQSVSIQDLETVRDAAPDRPLLIGSGASAKNLKSYLQYVDGIIVGSSLKEDGQLDHPVSLQRVEEFVRLSQS